MSSPVENFDISCDAYFSLTRGTMNLLAESARKGLALPVPAPQIIRKALGGAELTPTLDFPGIYYAATGEDRAIGELTAKRLVAVLSALSVEDRSSMDTPTVVSLLKMGLEWSASAEASLIRQFRAKHKKAYIITAHFYAGMWKIREIIKGLCQRGLWQEESGTVDGFWWMLTPKILCKKAVELLPGEPRERLSWVHDTIRELDTD
ncbi:hypothetical protein H072_7765 [Dactylellina haptotyla CBS 200.50]|uniref:Uncharacterized protein n=1 Tax=Dactylellina haptotyla (strain CBS 200.50) TaxID=1284197 RepID=S8BGR2_DACHA|nr:hypothetical protein H072_7765 [Dactylellina haptotyla CBS 200.50]